MVNRTCIITGETDETTNLLRFVVGPDKSLIPDVLNKLPGRGAYTLPKPEYVKEALYKKRFAKHLGFYKHLSPRQMDLFLSSLENLLQKNFIEQIGLVRKRGSAVAGAGNLRENQFAKGLLIAADASKREARKIMSLTRPSWILKNIPAETLGKAFGRNSIAFVGIYSLKNEENNFDGHLIRRSFRRWEAFIHENSCQRGTDGCINERI
jgi:Predicted nucleic-acid-binding protein implicated in transcription termination